MIATILWFVVTMTVLLVNAACVCGGLLGAIMITQFLEHSVLLAVQRHDLARGRSIERQRVLFYRIYWSLVLLYLAATALWVHLSDRSHAKLLYGVTFLLAMQLSQLALAVMLSSWDDTLTRTKALSRHKLVRSLRARVRRLSGATAAHTH